MRKLNIDYRLKWKHNGLALVCDVHLIGASPNASTRKIAGMVSVNINDLLIFLGVSL